MIGYFPRAYPDEILYSLCARFHDMLKFPSTQAVSVALFGKKDVAAVVDLPSQLGHLARSLPRNNTLDFENLIFDHTLYPYYAPFLPLSSRVQIMAQMKDGDAGKAQTIAGIRSRRISPHSKLRFCPSCVSKERRISHECYWHRMHQLPGIEICPEHGHLLEDSEVPTTSRRNPFKFYSAESVIGVTPSLRLDKPDHIQATLHRIAVSAEWLLKNRVDPEDDGFIHNRYRAILYSTGLSSFRGRINNRKLLDRFLNIYDDGLLNLLRCGVSGAGYHCWLFDIIRPRPRNGHHPIQHLLVMDFLGHSAESFFESHSFIKPFGEGPWPCWNPVCEQFRLPVIEEYELSINDRHAPVGTFKCRCGFAYARQGPDTRESDRQRISYVKSFGPVWERELADMWRNNTISLRKIARRFKTDRARIGRIALKQGLPFPRHGQRLASLKNGSSEKTIPKTKNIAKRLIYRKEVVSFKDKHPGLCRTEISRTMSKQVSWLKKNDPDWLVRNLPRAQEPRIHIRRKIPLENIDAKISEEVKSQKIRMLLIVPPKRITRTAIAKAVGRSWVIRDWIASLPKTAKALEGIAETRVDFAIRRINLIADRFRRQSVLLNKWMIVEEANIALDIRHDERIIKAIEVASGVRAIINS